MTPFGDSRQVQTRGELQVTDDGVVCVRGTVRDVTEPTSGDG
jgi:hypothetical protein